METRTFPDYWELQTFNLADAPAIGDDEIRRALHNPIGSPRIAELARDRRDAVIVVDDLSRPTPGSSSFMTNPSNRAIGGGSSSPHNIF